MTLPEQSSSREAGRLLTQELGCLGRSRGGALSRAPHGRPSLEGSWHPGHFLPKLLIPEKRANMFPLQTMLEWKPLCPCSAPLPRGQPHGALRRRPSACKMETALRVCLPFIFFITVGEIFSEREKRNASGVTGSEPLSLSRRSQGPSDPPGFLSDPR